MNKPLCRCGANPARPVNRLRGLCWICYYTPGLREQFASTSKFARGSPVKDSHRQRLEPTPTGTLPRTESKFAELARRAAAGLSLFSSADAVIGDETVVPRQQSYESKPVGLERQPAKRRWRRALPKCVRPKLRLDGDYVDAA
jgi:hypothetical protein